MTLLTGLILGTAFGTGLLLIVLDSPRWRRRPVHQRIDPYVRRGGSGSLFAAYEQVLSGHPFLRRNILPTVRTVVGTAARLLGSREEIAQRLELAGRPGTVDSFRAEQALWAGAGFLASLVFAGALIAGRGVSVPPLLLLIAISTVVGALARDRWLTQQIQRRAKQLAREFPAMADLLALAVAAGEGTVAAIERVARTSSGPLAQEMGRTVADVRAGATIHEALDRLGRRTPLEFMSRFTDSISVAIERGTPLVDVLRAQAQDARDISKRALMETAGQREIWMLMPVVFLLMPLVIVFAIFPGLSVLSISL